MWIVIVEQSANASIIDSYTNVRHEIIDQIPPGAPTMLDVGCSTGATGVELKSRNPAIRVVGLDISPAAVEIARRVYDAAYVCDLDRADALDCLGKEQFDVIIAPDVLEHLKDPQRALSSLLQRLAPGGVVVVSLPNIQHWTGIAAIASGRFPRDPAGLFDSTHLRWFTRREAAKMFSDCDLDVVGFSRSFRLSKTRRAKPLWPLLALVGDYFAMQFIFKLKPRMNGPTPQAAR
jgi:2-polyprenyl-3-methyl-5-hydroxy-6-metoxy-1,4-benzoquinol methylase